MRDIDYFLEHFDHFSPDVGADPFPIYAAMRERCPVAHSSAFGGFWVVSRYRDVSTVAHDDETYCSGMGVSIPNVGQARPLRPIEVDPPELGWYRRLLNPLFSPGAVRRWEPEIRSLTSDLIDDFIGTGSCDIVHDLAQPLPAILTLRMLGLPEERWEEFVHYIHVCTHEAAYNIDAGIEAALNVYSAIAEGIDDRIQMGGNQADDVLGQLMSVCLDSRRLTETEILDICFLLLFGGLDTTTAVIANSVIYLAEHPEHRNLLAAEPSLLPVAIEEFLRYFAPVHGLARTVTRATTLGGRELSAGDKVWMLWASANRDPEEFPEPDKVFLDRQPNRHLAFGVGSHRCLGSNLGRTEIQIVLEEVLKRIPDLRLDEEADVEFFPDAHLWGPSSARLQFSPGVPRSVKGH